MRISENAKGVQKTQNISNPSDIVFEPCLGSTATGKNPVPETPRVGPARFPDERISAANPKDISPLAVRFEVHFASFGKFL
jgi:hypothetical protein